MNGFFKKIALTILLILIFNDIAFCQNSNDFVEKIATTKVEKQFLTADILFPGIGFEYRLLNTSTLKLSSRLMPSIGIGNNKINSNWTQQFGVQFRHYYNLKDRVKLGRNVTKNSLNYIGIRPAFNYNYNFPESSTIALSPMWGLQRSYNNWYINAELGIDIYLKNSNISSQTIFPLINFSFGYILFKKQ